MSDNSTHTKDNTRRTIIPKRCCLCDVCNKQLTDERFVAIVPCAWFEGYLYCQDCEQEHKPAESGMQLIKRIDKGENLSGTPLSNPLIIESWDIES